MKKFVVVLLAVCFVMVMAVGCTGTTTAPSAAPETSAAATEATATEATDTSEASADTASEPAEGKVWKIAVSTTPWDHEYTQNMLASLKEQDAIRDDVELTIVDGGDQVEQELNHIDTLIAQGMDGIIMCPVSVEGSGQAIVAAKAANIPLIEMVSLTENEDYDTFVGTDPKVSGVMAAEAVVDAIGEQGNVLELQGLLGHSGMINRGAGIAEVLDQYPDIKMLDQQTADFEKDKAVSVVETWLAKYPEGEIDAILCHNDAMAIGAMNACASANRPEIKIVGIDGDLENLKAVADGRLLATIVDDIETECVYAIEEMVNILNGSEPKGKILVDYVPVATTEAAEEWITLRSH